MTTCRYKGYALFFMVWIMMIYNVTAQIRTDLSLAELDSLISLLPDLKGKERVDHLNMIATSISQRFPDSCIFYANQAKELSDSLLYEFGGAVAVFNIGNGYFYKIDVRNAIIHYLAASEYFEKEQPCQEYGNLLMQIASLNRYLENDLKAIEYYKKARNIFMQVDNRVSMMVAQYKMVFSFIQLENFDSALIYARQALKECKEIGHLKHLSSVYQMIGITYEWQDDLNPERERNGGRLAIPFLDSAYYYAKLAGYPLAEQTNLANIGECYHHYMNPPDYKKAEAYYLRSLQVNMESEPNQYFNIAEILAWLGELYADMGNYSKAEIYLNKALDEVSSYSSRKSIRVPSFQYDRIYVDLNYSWWARHSVYRGFMELYQYKGEYEKALKYSELRHKALDSLNQVTILNQIGYLLAGAENERINHQFKLLEKEKELQKSKAQRNSQLLIGISILTVLIIFIALLMIRHGKEWAKQEKIRLQQRLLRAQMNPHFIFNSLYSIQNFIVTEKPDKASIYLSKFAKLVRNILDNSTEEFVVLEKEISTIENYLELQKVRYAGKFDYRIDIDNDIDPEIVRIPPMLAQPFIENAIEHGIKHRETPGHIDIRFSMKDDTLIFEVEDDGVGRQKAREIEVAQDPGHRSMATSLTHERLANLNRKLHKKIFLEIIDLKNALGEATGTKVVFGVPVI